MKNIYPWIPSVLIMLAIFILSSIPGKEINQAGLGKESYHITGHFFLFMLLCASYYKTTKDIPLSILLTVFYGVFDEYHQIFTPNRTAGPFDIIVNSSGAVLAGIFIWKLQPILPKKLKNWLIN